MTGYQMRQGRLLVEGMHVVNLGRITSIEGSGDFPSNNRRFFISNDAGVLNSASIAVFIPDTLTVMVYSEERAPAGRPLHDDFPCCTREAESEGDAEPAPFPVEAMMAAAREVVSIADQLTAYFRRFP